MKWDNKVRVQTSNVGTSTRDTGHRTFPRQTRTIVTEDGKRRRKGSRIVTSFTVPEFIRPRKQRNHIGLSPVYLSVTGVKVTGMSIIRLSCYSFVHRLRDWGFFPIQIRTETSSLSTKDPTPIPSSHLRGLPLHVTSHLELPPCHPQSGLILRSSSFYPTSQFLPGLVRHRRSESICEALPLWNFSRCLPSLFTVVRKDLELLV